MAYIYILCQLKSWNIITYRYYGYVIGYAKNRKNTHNR